MEYSEIIKELKTLQKAYKSNTLEHTVLQEAIEAIECLISLHKHSE